VSESGNQDKMPVIITVGHSNIELEAFIRLLTMHHIEILADVRTAPYSRYAPQFNHDVLENAIPQHGIKYVFLGATLGGRPADAPLDAGGQPDYQSLAVREDFVGGIETLLGIARESRTCVLCSEEDPGHCHRGLLIGRVLSERGVTVIHIRGDGSTETQSQMCLRMTKGQLSLF
jgi:uncharacterized protein (DUF488 family)